MSFQRRRESAAFWPSRIRLAAVGRPRITASFRPATEIVVLRTYLRHPANPVEEAASHIQGMQKALTQMNLVCSAVPFNQFWPRLAAKQAKAWSFPTEFSDTDTWKTEIGGLISIRRLLHSCPESASA